MNYRIYTRQKTISSLTVLISLILFSSVLIFLFSTNRRKHEISSLPKINTSYIANIRDNTATVYWSTSEALPGYVQYGLSENDLSLKAYDERDKSDNPSARKNHLVTLKNLKPDTQYYYQFILNGQSLGETKESSFSLRTTRQINSTFDINPIYGKILSTNSKPADNALVIFQIDKTYPLISLSKIDGSYLIYACCIFSDTSYEPFYPSGEQKSTLQIIDDYGNTKRIRATLNYFQSNHEPIILDNKEISLLDEDNEKNFSKDLNDTTSDFLLSADQVRTYDPIDLIFPKENSFISAGKPLIKGVGIPGKKVKGTIEPDGKIFVIDINNDGVWNFLPQFSLPAGSHSIQVNTQDDEGKQIAFKRTFTILKDGEAILGDATTSGRLTPTVSPELSTTPELSPTITEITPLPSPTKEPPISGSSIAPFILLGVALVIIGSGVVLLF